jgi:hypothetical protein
LKKIALIFAFSFLFAKLHIQLPPKNLEYFYVKGKNGPKIVIIGGIHGNEIGGYLSAFLLKNLKIDRGEILVIPNANIVSIMANVRGYNGDMNKKFDDKKHTDKDYKYVLKIEKLILNFKPDLLLSLHDGYGFSIKDKKAWGQSIVIDEARYKRFNLLKTARFIQKEANKKLRYKVGIINTHTFSKKGSYNKNGLTGWSLKNNIEAYSLEASKNIGLKERIFTHKTLIGAFFKKLSIKSNIDKLNVKTKNPKLVLKVNGKTIKIDKATTLTLSKNSQIKVFISNGYYFVPRGVNLNWNSFYFKDVKFDVKYGNKILYTVRIKEE